MSIKMRITNDIDRGRFAETLIKADYMPGKKSGKGL